MTTTPGSWSSEPEEQAQKAAIARVPDSVTDPAAGVTGDAWGSPVTPATPAEVSAQARHREGSAGGPVSAEGRFVAGRGKGEHRHFLELQEQQAGAEVSSAYAQSAAERAARAHRQREEDHRGGNLPWFLRVVVPVACVTEAVTAYVAMEALVPTVLLADALSVLVALVGTGMACILANRRLNRLPVQPGARAFEGVFVAVLTVLRYESLRVQGAGTATAVGAAALAALVSALGLLGIEEVVVETRTFAMVVSGLWMSWMRVRAHRAAARLARIRARIRTAADRMSQHFVAFLMQAEQLPPAEAQRRAQILRAVLTDRDA
jgi:hypothetical protein